MRPFDDLSEPEKTAIKQSFEAEYGTGTWCRLYAVEIRKYKAAWDAGGDYRQSISNSFSQSQPESSDLAATLKKKNAEIGWLRAKAARVQAELNELALMLDKL